MCSADSFRFNAPLLYNSADELCFSSAAFCGPNINYMRKEYDNHIYSYPNKVYMYQNVCTIDIKNKTWEKTCIQRIHCYICLLG